MALWQIRGNKVREAPPSTLAVPPVLAPVMMMAFWMLLGAAAGIRPDYPLLTYWRNNHDERIL
jgi:hypothetical protein